MIISDRYRFCFLHIPKCAGTTVRQRLLTFDDANGFFEARVAHHEQLGLLDYTHIPLATLEKHFPREYEKIRQYSSFAVVRDPYKRFPSSITQRVKKSTGVQIRYLSANDIKREVEQSIRYLQSNTLEEVLPPDYIHFQKQYTYLYAQGELVVKNVFPTFAVNSLFERLSSLTEQGVAAAKNDSAPVINEGLVYRSDFLQGLHKAVGPTLSRLSKTLPGSRKLRNSIRRKMYVSRDSRLGDIFQSEYIKDFIADYYREDIKLYQEWEASYRAIS